MSFEKIRIRMTDHAYERYLQRVGPADRDQLTEQLSSYLRRPDRRKGSYIRLAGVWWRFSVQGGTCTLHTCYGRHVGDLPEAIRWAKRHGDRIALGDRGGC